MASPFASVIPVWQDPYVEVIKFGMTHRNVGWHAQGEVEQTQDQQIHKNVFRIRGAIAATNYLRVPRDATKGTHGLGLTGRYAYIQMRRVRDLPMTIHLDFVTNKKVALRFTLSSIYQAFRSTGTALRAPLSLDARWTVVVIDMVRLLELHSFNQYARDTYRHLKTITLCASMNVRNFFVSPTLYTPRTLPANLCFPGAFGDQYRWLVVPSEVSPSLEHPRRDAIQQEEQRIAATPKPGIRHGKEGSVSTAAGAAISLMARQTSDFVIDRIAFSPYEQHDNYHLVSCGRENVRYWRVNPNTGHLTGCPVILNEYSRGTVFTDIGFDTIVESHPSDIRRVRPLYVASSLGTLLVIDYDLKQMTVSCVFGLWTSRISSWKHTMKLEYALWTSRPKEQKY
ncbi:WD repeat-containing protein 90 [Phytophthora ramorum]|uniref:WD repeat-containing protein 90 n=1 Tax=Phytophthora ramorum TaxID=164328 RepID=UPI0030ABA9DF|nr:WD repeat-containing protein 90 [Phytophthora ramorum]